MYAKHWVTAASEEMGVNYPSALTKLSFRPYISWEWFWGLKSGAKVKQQIYFKEICLFELMFPHYC